MQAERRTVAQEDAAIKHSGGDETHGDHNSGSALQIAMDAQETGSVKARGAQQQQQHHRGDFSCGLEHAGAVCISGSAHPRPFVWARPP